MPSIVVSYQSMKIDTRGDKHLILDKQNLSGNTSGRTMTSVSDEKFKQKDQYLIATFDQFTGKEGSWNFNR